MSRLYALLVGIDHYPTKPLTGCVNDIHAWKRYLEEWTGDDGRLSLEVLINEGATRQAILDAFRGGLGRAEKGDTALFCFSGHGSQELAPRPYCDEEPGGLSETLVAVDSRLEGGLDIADKELAVLVAEVARRGAHVAVVLDSCHSGTATRDPEEELGARRLAGVRWRRPEGSYWFQDGTSLPPELGGAGGWRVLPAGPHVLLAACEDWQTAIECTFRGEKRGLFSYYLLDTLARMGPGWSYRELFHQVQVRVRSFHPPQLPQAEGELGRGFLGSVVVDRSAGYHARRHKDGSWWLDAGTVHGLEQGTEVAILPLETSGSEDLSRRLATALVVGTEAGSSRLEIVEGELPRSPPAYPAVVTRLPRAPVRVAFEGETAGRTGLCEAIERSPYLALASEPAETNFVVMLETGRFRLRRPGIPWDLVPPFEESADAGDRLVGALEHAARWETIADLANPGSRLYDAVEMTLWEWSPRAGPELDPYLRPLPEEGELRLPYRETGEAIGEPRRICVHLESRWSGPLYFGLFALGETFTVKALSGGIGRLAADEEVWIGRAAGICAEVPDALHRRGVTQRRDLLVLLVSSAAMDFSLLEQGTVSEPGWRSAANRALPSRPGVLETLLRRNAWRELEDSPTVADQWATRSRALVAVRPQPWHSFSAAGKLFEPVPGIRLRAPRGLQGAARLQGPNTHPRLPGLASLTLDQQRRLRPVALAGALGSDPGLSTVELKATGWGQISAQEPLSVETDLALGDEEKLGTVVSNGERTVLVAGSRDGSGRGFCRVEALPVPAAEGGTLWLEFYALR